MGQWLIWWLASMGGGALVTAFVSRRWVWQAALIYLASPLILFFGWLGWQVIVQPEPIPVLGAMVFALAVASSFVALPWFATCLVGFGVGLVPRRWIRPPLAPVAAVAAVALPTSDWRAFHVGVENDAVAIAGVELWKQPWRPAGLPPVSLPHPAHLQQMHRFEIYDVGASFSSHRFAAGELSNGVWGFYVPGSAAVAEEEALSGDGSLRYVRRRYGPEFNASAVTLSDVATGAIYFDGKGYEDARIFEQTDGTLTLRVIERSLSGVIHIYPLEKVFRVSGSSAPGRPLTQLQGAVSEVLLASGGAPTGNTAARPVKPPFPWLLLAMALGAVIVAGVVSYLTESRRAPTVQITPMPAMPPIPGNPDPFGPKR